MANSGYKNDVEQHHEVILYKTSNYIPSMELDIFYNLILMCSIIYYLAFTHYLAILHFLKN